jgi:hypothetical protein
LSDQRHSEYCADDHVGDQREDENHFRAHADSSAL